MRQAALWLAVGLLVGYLAGAQMSGSERAPTRTGASDSQVQQTEPRTMFHVPDPEEGAKKPLLVENRAVGVSGKGIDVHFDKLPPGKYQIFAQVPEFERATATATIANTLVIVEIDLR